MATLTAKLILQSGDLLSNDLDITVNNSLTLSHGGIERKKVTATAAGGSATVLYTADVFAAPAYLYIRNTDSAETDYIYVYNDTASGDPVELKIPGGEFAWLPLAADQTLMAYAASAGTVVEVGVFGDNN